MTCPSCGHENRAGARFCEACGTALAVAAATEQRKTVTVLFCDITGSTALGETVDPERLRALMARYFERMKAIVEHHGGTVEKFIGDAVMAVFGVPVVREDDALRAVRAAIEMRDALPELGIEGRIGVTTGEVVAGTEERLATGDAVNVAARLEQAAPPGEVLAGEPTVRLLAGAADVEPIAPLVLKGKAEPVPAFRVVAVRDGIEPRHELEFVGREGELAAVRNAAQQARREQRCVLATIVGDPGVGKSRLVAEAVAALGTEPLRGRCAPYGEGITYRPVLDVLKQLDVPPPDPAAAAAIGSLLGETERTSSADEIAWAFRKTLEHAAADELRVVVFDDIHWGDETFLDLVEHVALFSTGAPILLLCLARPELVERRPSWPITLRLEPLPADDVERLLPERLEPDLREKIARAAAGNPLFVGEMLAIADEADGEVAVPPTLQALLAARLDRLDAADRNVLERGAVEGEVFHRGAVQALAADGAAVMPRLASLVRKELIRPDAAQLPGDDGFRFRHLLIRDAAYDALPKAVRAELHERFARWLEERGAALIELHEIAGYHLEQAVRYRDELGLRRDEALAADAREHLTLAARRLYVRAAESGAISIFERAVALLEPGQIDLALETDLIENIKWGGRPEDALRRAHAIVDRAAAAGDRTLELAGLIEMEGVRAMLEPEGAADRIKRRVAEATPLFEDAGDDVALYRAFFTLGQAESMLGRLDSSQQAFDRAAAHAHAAGLPYFFTAWRASARLNGSTPASELLRWLEEQEATSSPTPYMRRYRAEALVRLGRVDEGRAELDHARRELAERDAGVALGNALAMAASIELIAGDPDAAARFGEEGSLLLDSLGDKGFLSTTAAILAAAYVELGRLEDAERWADRSAEVGASDDAVTQVLWRQAKARVLARRGRHGDAERLARQAVELAEPTDMIEAQAGAYADLAEVLLLAGNVDEAEAALREAVHRYDRKENVVAAARVRGRLAELRAAAP